MTHHHVTCLSSPLPRFLVLSSLSCVSLVSLSLASLLSYPSLKPLLSSLVLAFVVFFFFCILSLLLFFLLFILLSFLFSFRLFLSSSSHPILLSPSSLQLVVAESKATIKSIEIQLVRVESASSSDGDTREGEMRLLALSFEKVGQEFSTLSHSHRDPEFTIGGWRSSSQVHSPDPHDSPSSLHLSYNE